MGNYYKKKIISAAAPVLSGLQLHRLFAPFYAGIGQILMLHRVVAEEGQVRIHNHQSLEISPEQFESTLNFYRNKGYRFVSMDQVYEILKSGKTSRPFVAITFDDGYRDNYTTAYPILKKHRIPFTIYITNCIPDRSIILWWYLLEDLVRAQSSISFQWKKNHYSFSCHSPIEKEQAFEKIRTLINQELTKDHERDLLKAIFGHFTDDLYYYSKTIGMNWEEINTLCRDPLATIGAHTVNHRSLRQLEADELAYEIMVSREQIEKQIGRTVEHFAYPFGKASEASLREFQLIKSLGFKTAVTTRMGNIFPAHHRHLECLPRININKASRTEVLQLQSSGMLPCLYHLGKKIVTD